MSPKYHFVHERGDYPPLAIEDIASAWTGNIKKTVGCNESPIFFIFQNTRCRIYSYERVHQKIINYTFRKISQDKSYIKKVRQTFDRKAKLLKKFIKRIEKINWQKAKISILINLKREYTKLYQGIVPFGEPLPYFLKEKLQWILERYLLKKLKVSLEDFAILMTPLYQSFLSKESQELWKIVRKNKNNPSKLTHQIKKYLQKYSWLLFDYASIVATLSYFQKRVKTYLLKPPELINYQKLKIKKQQIIKQYKVTDKYQYYINLLEDLFYLMDKKKEVLTQAHFALTPLYQEAGRRLGFNLEDIRWFLWHEVAAALNGQRILQKKTIRKRKKLSVIKYQEGKPFFLKTIVIKKLLEDIKKEERSAIRAPFIKGVAASSGKVIGRVRYLKSARENHKIKKGEILLVSNTTPDFMPAIQKAVAIITNEGGLTCHAAIMSRELGIPCIVGTKIATKILKDGDQVEVDATKGIVRVLKS